MEDLNEPAGGIAAEASQGAKDDPTPAVATDSVPAAAGNTSEPATEPADLESDEPVAERDRETLILFAILENGVEGYFKTQAEFDRHILGLAAVISQDPARFLAARTKG